MIDIDSEDRGEQIANILASVVSVGRVGIGPVARGDIKAAVLAELQTAAVVPAGQESELNLLAQRIHSWRFGIENAKTRDPRAIG